jgi:hypothetical protein
MAGRLRYPLEQQEPPDAEHQEHGPLDGIERLASLKQGLFSGGAAAQPGRK